MNQDQPQADESREEKALRVACHDMAKMEASAFGMPIEPDRPEQLFKYYLEMGNSNEKASKGNRNS